MPTKPTDNPAWDTSGTNVTEPGSGTRAAGYAFEDELPSDEYNWMIRAHGRWIDYFSETVATYSSLKAAFDELSPGDSFILLPDQTASPFESTASVALGATPVTDDMGCCDGRYVYVGLSNDIKIYEPDLTLVTTLTPSATTYAASTEFGIHSNGEYLVIARPDGSTGDFYYEVRSTSDFSTVVYDGTVGFAGGGSSPYVAVGPDYAFVGGDEIARIDLSDGSLTYGDFVDTLDSVAGGIQCGGHVNRYGALVRFYDDTTGGTEPAFIRWGAVTGTSGSPSTVIPAVGVGTADQAGVFVPGDVAVSYDSSGTELKVLGIAEMDTHPMYAATLGFTAAPDFMDSGYGYVVFGEKGTDWEAISWQGVSSQAAFNAWGVLSTGTEGRLIGIDAESVYIVDSSDDLHKVFVPQPPRLLRWLDAANSEITTGGKVIADSRYA